MPVRTEAENHNAGTASRVGNIPLDNTDIRHVVSHQFAGEDKDSAVRYIEGRIAAGRQVLHAVGVADFLLTMNERGLSGKGKLYDRAKLLRVPIHDPDSEAVIGERLGVVSAISLLFDRGVDRGREVYGQYAVGIRDDGVYGFAYTSSLDPNHNSPADLSKLYVRLKEHAFATVGNIHADRDVADTMRVIIDGRVDVGEKALQALRLSTARMVDAFMETDPAVA